MKDTINKNKIGAAETILCVDKRKERSLLSPDDVKFLQDIIIERDRANNPMSRKEAIYYIQSISGSDNKTAADHFKWLRKSKQMNKLKNDGRVVAAQKCTTKRSQIRTESQLRWFSLVDTVWEDIKRYNVLPEGSTKPPFPNVQEYFWLNLDETCIIADDGNVKVLSAKEEKQH